jgi:hypothetical protein
LGWIYKLKDNFSLNPWVNGYRYYPVKKKYTPMFNPITLYRRYNDTEGICGLGDIIEYESLKSSEITLIEGLKLFDKSYFQIKIKLNCYTPEGLFIDREILKQFPSYNRKSFEKPLNPYTLYFDGGLNYSINYIYKNFHYDFFSIIDINKNLWRYYIHLLREKAVANYWRNRLPMKYKKCIQCGLKSEVPYFLEIHDNVAVDFAGEYIPVNINDFIVLCPNCHKSIHQKMKKGEKNKIRGYCT